MPNYQVTHLCKCFLQIVPDKLFLKIMYYKNFKKYLSFSHLKTFNEKIQYLKLYQTDQIFADLTDKYRVREFVAKKIPEDILIPLLWVGENPEEIPYQALPEKFIIKCNHGSEFNIIIYDKNSIDKNDIILKLKNWLKEDFWTFLRENHYKKIRKKLILIEELLPGEMGPLPIDYKIYCFHGNVTFLWLTLGRGSTQWIIAKLYDAEWNKQDFSLLSPIYDWEIPKPDNLEKIVKYAQILSEGFPFVRVDLYNVKGKIYFGELTFTPFSGYAKFLPRPEEIDAQLWELLILK